MFFRKSLLFLIFIFSRVFCFLENGLLKKYLNLDQVKDFKKEDLPFLYFNLNNIGREEYIYFYNEENAFGADLSIFNKKDQKEIKKQIKNFEVIKSFINNGNLENNIEFKNRLNNYLLKSKEFYKKYEIYITEKFKIKIKFEK